MSTAAVVFVLVRKADVVRGTDLVWLGLFFGLSLLAIRSLVLWAFVAPFVLARFLRIRKPTTGRGSPHLNVAFVVALVGAGVVLLPWLRPVQLSDAPQSAVVAVRRATDPGARLVVAQRWASWFELASPDRRVFVDSRIELFAESVWADYDALASGRADWAEVADRWEADAIVAESSWPVVPFIRQHEGWRLVFEDADGLVFVRV
jgi:hypothetical protein